MKLDSPEKLGRRLRGVGPVAAIPFVMAFGPLIGFFIGRWLDKQFDTKPYLTITLIVLGFVAAGREVWALIKRSARETEDKTGSGGA